MRGVVVASTWSLRVSATLQLSIHCWIWPTSLSADRMSASSFASLTNWARCVSLSEISAVSMAKEKPTCSCLCTSLSTKRQLLWEKHHQRTSRVLQSYRLPRAANSARTLWPLIGSRWPVRLMNPSCTPVAGSTTVNNCS